jgi:hypothetical protein
LNFEVEITTYENVVLVGGRTKGEKKKRKGSKK